MVLSGAFGQTHRMTTSEIDEAALSSWLRESGRALARLERLSGDVSPRRYGRVELEDGARAIVAVYPTGTRDSCHRFVSTTAILENAWIPVPRILEVDCSRGFMLLEDAGRRTLFDLRGRPLEERLPHFEEAVAVARHIALLPTDRIAELNPPLDADLLERELRQTIDVFLAPCDLLGDARSRSSIESALGRLCQALGESRPVACHRDFMSRNLVPRTNGGVTVLDHQDLRLGPPAYDLASLLNDSFFPPPEIEARLLGDSLSNDELRASYHRAAAQRTLKAIGTFTSFAARGFERHVSLIPPTLSRALHHLGLAPESAPLAALLEQLWGPVADDGLERHRTD